MTVLAACPFVAPPHAVWMAVLFAAYSTASRQCTLLSGATLVLMYMKRANPLNGLSAWALSAGLDRILACDDDATPWPCASTSISPASSPLSMSAWFTFRLMTIWLGSCLAFGSVAGFQSGFGTKVSCLFSV